MGDIIPFLWFNKEAEEAAKFYVSVFKNSKITNVSYYPEGAPANFKPGSVMTVEFELQGKKFMALNGGPAFKFTEAISLMIYCKDQKEIDHYWSRLTANGGKDVECGWVKDKYGLSWQIIPEEWPKWMQGPKENKDRMLKAVWSMKKIDIAKIKAAYAGK